MTVKDWLVGVFGRTALSVHGVDSEQLGGCEVTEVVLLCDEDGRLGYKGGVGSPLVSFGPVELLYDDMLEQKWLTKVAAGGKKSIGPRPEARLRLVRKA